MQYKASFDTQSKLITIGAFILFGYVIYRNIDDMSGIQANTPTLLKHSFISILLISTLLICYLNSIKYYLLDKNEIVIKRPIGDIKIKIADIDEVRKIEVTDMLGTIRVFGSRGLFGYIGRFRNRILGNFNLYATNNKNRILIVTDERKKMILSPDELTFLDDLKKELEKRNKKL